MLAAHALCVVAVLAFVPPIPAYMTLMVFIFCVFPDTRHDQHAVGMRSLGFIASLHS